MESFKVIGIAVRTSNVDGQMAKDIGALWEVFLGQRLMDKIPNKLSNAIYELYTDYEGDFMAPYTVVLGCKVSSFDEVPEGMVSQVVPGGTFEKFVAKGNLNEGAVFHAWQKIWQTELDRAYTCDFEVYDERSQDPSDAEVDIYVALNS
ncbi:MAG: hypothetical protein S4CHLAM102_02600 [Chlamydiia bacterium]|nr:hypothetical protein [Chlamydiia bacterium]